MGRRSGPIDDDKTSIYEGRPKKETKRGHELGPEAKKAIRAISMKTPHDPDAVAKIPAPPVLPHVKLRAMSEVAKSRQPQNLGNLAPPYDPAAARARSMREYVIWGSVAVMIACGIGLIVICTCPASRSAMKLLRYGTWTRSTPADRSP